MRTDFAPGVRDLGVRVDSLAILVFPEVGEVAQQDWDEVEADLVEEACPRVLVDDVGAAAGDGAISGHAEPQHLRVVGRP